MTNKQKADLIAWLHLSLILLGIVSLPLVFIISWWKIVVFVLAGLSVLSWIIWKDECWITSFEKKYRKLNGDSYEAGFIKYYLKKIFNITASSGVISVILYGYIGILISVALIKSM